MAGLRAWQYRTIRARTPAMTGACAGGHECAMAQAACVRRGRHVVQQCTIGCTRLSSGHEAGPLQQPFVATLNPPARIDVPTLERIAVALLT